MQNRSFAAAVKAAFPHPIPIMTGYLAVGMAYGVLMASKGYGFLWAGFVSAFALCGSMQYVALTLLTTAFDPLQAFVLSMMVNARHLDVYKRQVQRGGGLIQYQNGRGLQKHPGDGHPLLLPAGEQRAPLTHICLLYTSRASSRK